MDWDPRGTLAANDRLQMELRPPTVSVHWMAWQAAVRRKRAEIGWGFETKIPQIVSPNFSVPKLAPNRKPTPRIESSRPGDSKSAIKTKKI